MANAPPTASPTPGVSCKQFSSCSSLGSFRTRGAQCNSAKHCGCYWDGSMNDGCVPDSEYCALCSHRRTRHPPPGSAPHPNLRPQDRLLQWPPSWRPRAHQTPDEQQNVISMRRQKLHVPLGQPQPVQGLRLYLRRQHERQYRRVLRHAARVS